MIIIFFQLSCWPINKLYNRDVVHMKKKFCDSLVATLLEVLGKSKDHNNSCYNLQVMGIFNMQHPITDNTNGKVYFSKSYFSMKPKEKKVFCTVFKNAKLPKWCTSDILKRVDVEQIRFQAIRFMMIML